MARKKQVAFRLTDEQTATVERIRDYVQSLGVPRPKFTAIAFSCFNSGAARWLAGIEKAQEHNRGTPAKKGKK